MEPDRKFMDDMEQLRKVAERCFVVHAYCGYLLDENDAMVMHHPSPEEARGAAADYGFLPAPGGEYRCSPDCGACAEAVTR